MHFRVEMLVILWRTAGKPSSMWWRAPTNRSQSDHIVLCNASIPRAYNLNLIRQCDSVISTGSGFSGNRGKLSCRPSTRQGGTNFDTSSTADNLTSSQFRSCIRLRCTRRRIMQNAFLSTTLSLPLGESTAWENLYRFFGACHHTFRKK